jgi:hypothetical protein
VYAQPAFSWAGRLIYLYTQRAVKIHYALEHGYFYQSDLLRATTTGCDVLYIAERDFRPPTDRGYSDSWRFDRVHWSGHDLPTGELKRSIGHWNPPDQAEHFLCTEGLVYLIFALEPGFSMGIVRCTVGEAVFLSRGAWHQTFAETERAAVENRYSYTLLGERPKQKYEHNGLRVSLLREPDKSGITLVNLGERPITFTLTDAAQLCANRWDSVTDLPFPSDVGHTTRLVTCSKRMTLLPGGSQRLED